MSAIAPFSGPGGWACKRRQWKQRMSARCAPWSGQNLVRLEFVAAANSLRWNAGTRFAVMKIPPGLPAGKEIVVADRIAIRSADSADLHRSPPDLVRIP